MVTKLTLLLVLWLSAAPSATSAPGPGPGPADTALPEFRFTNSLTGTELRFRAFVPPDDPRSGPTRYPKIFWLPDAGETNGTPDFPSAAVLAAIRDGIIPPVVVILPGQGAASWFQDSADGRVGDETFFIRELLPYVERHLPVAPGRANRFLIGCGTGGFAAFRLAARHPQHFAAATSIEGAFPGVESISTNALYRDFHRQIYGGEFLRAATNQPAHIVQAHASRLRGQTGFQLIRSRRQVSPVPPSDRSLPEAFRAARIPLDVVELPDFTPNPLPAPLAAETVHRALEFVLAWSEAGRSIDRDGAWVNLATNRIPRVGHHLVYSRILQRPIGYNLYLPTNTPATPGPSRPALPVLYHLPGRGEDESRHLETVGYLDATIRVGEVPPTAWVWLYAGRHSWYTDSTDHRIPADEIVIRELMPRIEARWNLGGARERRALDGWGMGAYGALALAVRHTNQFHAVLLHNPDLPDELTFPTRHPDAWLAVFGGDPQAHAPSSPWTLLPHLGASRSATAPPFRLRVVVGENSPLRRDADRLHALLDGLRWPHEYQTVPRLATGGPALYPHTALRDLQFLLAR